MFSISKNGYAEQPIVFENLTIVVSSCDKYQEFWHPFFTFLFKNWPSLKKENAHIPILLITNKKSYNDPRVNVIKMGEDKTWSLNMIKALKKVKTKYILYLQEDYIIHVPVKERILHNLLSIMMQENPAYIKLTFDSFFANAPRHPNYKEIAIKALFSKYRNSMQASFWEKFILESLLDPTEDPWEFEKFGSIRSQKISKAFWIVQDNAPIIYFNACDRGYWAHPVLEYINARGLNIDIRRLPVDRDYPILHWLKHYYPLTYQELKKFDLYWLRGKLFKHEENSL